MTTAGARNRVGTGLLAALPDALTAIAFVIVWAAPLSFGALSVKTAMLTMLVEFFLVHATGFFTAFGNSPGTPRVQRVLILAGLSLFYLLMIGAFAWSFGEWWPLLAFAWLAVGKIAWTWRRPVASDGAMLAQMAAWAGSVVAYLGGCVLTVTAPVPRWGMTADLQPRFGLSGGGLWVDEPHRVVAFGVVYFGVLFIAKVVVTQVRRRQGASAASGR